MNARILAVSLSGRHMFSKQTQLSIQLLAGLGVDGDAHMGETVKHRSRVAKTPTDPNLRQVHLIQSELFDELRVSGFDIGCGDMGENIATTGIDLLNLPRGTRLRLGDRAIVELTGLRDPCGQIDRFRPGLMSAVLARAPDGALIRKAGVMSIVLEGGQVRPGDPIAAQIPPGAIEPLKVV